MTKKYIPYFEHKSIKRENKEFTLFEYSDLNLTTNIDNSSDVLLYLKTDGQYYTDGDNKNVENKVNVDFKNVSEYVKYKSAYQTFKQSLDFIKNNHIGALSVKKGIGQNNLLFNNYNPFRDISTIGIQIKNIESNSVLSVKNDKKINVSNDFTNFVFEYNSVEYPINNIKINSTVCEIEFVGYINIENNFIAYIKPTEIFKTTYNSIFSYVETYFLSEEKEKYFSIVFYDSNIDNNGKNIEFETEYRLYKKDKYNIDFTTNYYTDFEKEILEFGTKLDNIETDVLKRKFLPDSIYYNVNETENIDNLIDLYGAGYDIIWQSIINLKNLKNIDENSESYFLINTLFSQLGFTENLTDEVKKMLVINAAWIFKNKGKRLLILNLASIFGLNDKLLILNENIYKFKPFDTTRFNSEIYEDSVFLPFDEVGLPIKNNKIFEDSDYWDFYTVQSENGNEIIKKYDTIDETVIYNEPFQSSSSTININSVNACYQIDGYNKFDDIQEIIYDECGCPISVNDYMFEVKATIPPTNICKTIILDYWETCDDNGVKVNSRIYGGKPPYVYVGDGYSNILQNGESYSFYVEDYYGCISNTASGTTQCMKVNCFDNPIAISTNYVCITDNNTNTNTGEAIISYSINGGVEPYTLNPNFVNGQILQDGTIYQFTVTDALGCIVTSQEVIIDCGSKFTCASITLNTTCEVTSQPTLDSRIVNITYDLGGLPFNTNVDNVILTVSNGDIQNGSGVDTKTFNSQSGVNQVVILTNGIVDFNVDITVKLTDGCEYFLSYSFVGFDSDMINHPTITNYTLIN